MPPAPALRPPNDRLSPAGNLVVNGSFENVTGGGPPGGGQSNWRLWAVGTTQNFVPFAVPSGWSGSDNANSYAVWGNDAGDNAFGKSKRYDFLFSPLNTSVDVTIEFINYGHFDLSPYGRSTSTELVLDDAMVNALVPEPSTYAMAFAALACGGVSMWRRRKRA